LGAARFAAGLRAAARRGGADGLFAGAAAFRAGAFFSAGFFSAGRPVDLRRRCTSFSVNERRAPTGRARSRRVPMATRRSFSTPWPMLKNISRICRVRPSVSSTIHQELSPSDSDLRRAPATLKGARAVIRAGAVRLPSRTIPVRSFSSWASVGSPFTLTS
jgi:hypothetical protein